MTPPDPIVRLKGAGDTLEFELSPSAGVSLSVSNWKINGDVIFEANGNVTQAGKDWGNFTHEKAKKTLKWTLGGTKEGAFKLTAVLKRSCGGVSGGPNGAIEDEDLDLWGGDVISIESVEWEKINSDIGDNPNVGGGKRIFPDKLSPTDTTPRNTVRVKAKISKAQAGIDVYFKSFDVDDPSANWNSDVAQHFYVDNARLDSGDTATERKGGDNRSGEKPGEIIKEGRFSNGTSEIKAATVVTDEGAYATAVFTVGFQPGDNYRIAAAFSTDHLTPLNNDYVPADNAPQVSSGEDQFYKALFTPMLTIWRRLHLEIDSMRAPVGNENKVVGHVTRIAPGSDNNFEATLDIDLETDHQVQGVFIGSNSEDLSPNLKRRFLLHLAAKGLGRFENGGIIIGTGTDAAKTDNLLGNGWNFVRTKENKEFVIDFVISKPDREPIHGQVVGLDVVGISSILTVRPDPEGDDLGVGDFDDGNIQVAGQTFEVLSNTATTVTLKTADAKLDFVLHDDDEDSLVPYVAKIGNEFNEKYAPAYIVGIPDGGGNPANNKVTVPFYRNISPPGFAFGREGARETANAKSATFWVTSILFVFQSATHGNVDNYHRCDNDPETEGNQGAEADLGYGFIVYAEDMRDRGDFVRDQQGKWSVDAEERLHAHEVGHLFAEKVGEMPDYYDGPSSIPCPVKGTCGLMESHYPENNVFIAADLATLRSRRRSP